MHVRHWIPVVERPIKARLQIHQVYVPQRIVGKVQLQRWIQKVIGDDDYRHGGERVQQIPHRVADVVLEALELTNDDCAETSQASVELLGYLLGQHHGASAGGCHEERLGGLVDGEELPYSVPDYAVAQEYE